MIRMKMKKIISSLAAAAMLLTANAGLTGVEAADDDMRDITTTELVKDMGIGINLGNTFEACPNWYEEDWIARRNSE